MKALMVVGVAAALVGCTTPVYLGERNWNVGWREGSVAKPAQSKSIWRIGCGRSIETDDQVVIQYRSTGKKLWIGLPLGDNLKPPPGAKVLFNLNTCELVLL